MLMLISISPLHVNTILSLLISMKMKIFLLSSFRASVYFEIITVVNNNLSNNNKNNSILNVTTDVVPFIIR